MKTLMLFIVCGLIFGLSVSNATVWRVNSNPDANADFLHPQDAIDDDNVLPGDTLYLENGSFFHGVTTLNKKLTLIGPGYFLSENELSYAHPNPANVQRLDIIGGSSGSKISGVRIPQGIVVVPNNSDSIIGIVIERSFIGRRGGTGHYFYSLNIANNVINITVRNNYITSTSYGINLSGQNTTTNVYNNIILTSIGTIRALGQTGGNNIYNNVLRGNSLDVANSNVYNNIFVNPNNTVHGINFSVSNSTFHRNITTQLFVEGDPIDNLYGQIEEDIFILEGSPDAQWMLKEGSPAIGYGQNGVDAGAFGGPAKYVLSGLPFLVPRITEVNIPQGVSSNTIPVQIRATIQEE